MTGYKTAIAVCAMAGLMAAISGCNGVKEMSNKSSDITYAGDGIYPMQCDDTLTVWSASLGNGDLEKLPLGEEWKKQTGVNVEFIQPMSGAQEALSILTASGDLPDIMIAGLYNEPGGIQKYADEDIIIPITEYMEEYAPSYTKIVNDNPDVKKQITSDNGEIYAFTNIAAGEVADATSGIAVRKDMLDKAGLDVPETIDEWHTALTAFKEQGASAPLSYDLMYWERYAGVFTGAYGVKADFYLDDNGKVKYGILEPEMREAVATLAGWYKEGLIDQNIVKIADLDANILNSETGATCTWSGGGIGKYMNAMKDKNPEFNLVPARYPVLNKGDKPKFGSRGFKTNTYNNGFITTECKNVELAMRFLDFGYTEAGHMLFNFGKEGESYTMVDGYPTYTDEILNNPEGLSISEAMKKYIFASSSAPFVADAAYLEQYYQYPQQKQALEVWGHTTAPSNTIPLVSFTDEEGTKVNSIMSNVETAVDEMMYKFIMGIEPIDNYDSMVNTIKGFGIDEAIEIYQTAVGRYNAR